MDTLVERTSLVDSVAERLRLAILTGAIAPGERIRVGRLEQQFGVTAKLCYRRRDRVRPGMGIPVRTADRVGRAQERD